MKSEKPNELEAIFNPRSVAVIGASHSDDFTQALMRTKMRENLFLVNPKHEVLHGRKCYTSVLDINETIDYVIIATPAPIVPRVLQECVDKGVKAVHVFSAGFSETGLEDRKRLEEEVREIANTKIRLVGPNCMGIYCPQSGLSFGSHFSTEEGTVAVVSQSGTFAEQFSSVGKIRNLKFSKVVSYGNAVDLDCPDFLEYLADDPKTEVIAVYMEGTRNGKRLKQALARAAREKPVVALKGGVTEHGSRAASSHTGSMAGSPGTWKALFQQTGVVQVQSFDELLDASLALTRSPIPAGKGVSIITNSGGFSVIETDSCVKAGLEVPGFGEKTARELAKIVPTAGTSISNPLDAWPIYYNMGSTSGTIADAIKTVASDENIHALVLHFDELSYLRRMLGEGLERHLVELIQIMLDGCQHVRNRSGKPVMVCVSLEAYSEDEEDRRYHLMVKKAFEHERFPVYSSLDASIKALFNLYSYGTLSRRR